MNAIGARGPPRLAAKKSAGPLGRADAHRGFSTSLGDRRRALT
jgi:hypothetical protein